MKDEKLNRKQLIEDMIRERKERIEILNDYYFHVNQSPEKINPDFRYETKKEYLDLVKKIAFLDKKEEIRKIQFQILELQEKLDSLKNED